MKEINIAKKLIEKRKEKGITQDELASYIGVSKASVSKWETGHSYPDITFLPQLAAYFNISIDELIGYLPQMEKEDIKNLYYKLTAEFSTKPFGEVMDECHEIIKKYYSCFPLLLQMAGLLTNHYMLAKEKEEQEATLQEVIHLCERIKAEAEEMQLINQANSIEAICWLILGNADKVMELLDGIMKPSSSNETLLASAYQMTGNMEKAKEVLQAGIYLRLVELMGMLPSYLLLCQGDSQRFESTLNRAVSMAGIFDLDRLHAGVMLQIYLAAAQGYAMQSNPERALDLIEKYAAVCTSEAFPFTLHGDNFFDSIDPWFADFDLGNQAPRSDKVIKESMLQGLIENPFFTTFADQPRFQRILASMKSRLEER
ncbi:helix-turn-helix domain-containing protein [Clostridium aminobutyricum]|uniref:Helix-turn-helix transcriptional regulator n=1 Tax=Clostridium aminobutyricum TaxID=33953 RepID=A0A939D6I5_CLOAM|nr:helix-turn-helix transcriptional regulator [Clostridium aminobutyricum]MBN7772339.1 helix-turn-helix transcriptional regulator [Clostridium aminobutyricum]